jgi:major membrane immunogen (membrane-anchored lipoprotein)
VKALLTVVVTILFLTACGDSESIEQKVCAVEIERKAEVAQWKVISKTFEGTGKTADGDTELSGKVSVTANGGDKVIPFSCVIQGSGDETSVIRLELQVY